MAKRKPRPKQRKYDTIAADFKRLQSKDQRSIIQRMAAWLRRAASH